MSTLDEIYSRAADQAIADGVACDDSPNGAIHQWVQQNVNYRPGTEFFIVLGIAGEMADRAARAEGFKSAADRAASRAWAKA